MREWLEDLSITMKVLALGLIALFVIGGGVLAWDKVFSPRFADNDRERFKHGSSHQDAVVQDFADRCRELATTLDPVSKRAIEAVIAQRAAVEDLSKLEMESSVRECVNTAINNYYHPAPVESK